MENLKNAAAARPEPAADGRWIERACRARHTLAARLNALERDRPEAEDRWHSAVIGLRDELAAREAVLEHVIASTAQLGQLADEQARMRVSLASATRAQATAGRCLAAHRGVGRIACRQSHVLRQQIVKLAEDGAALREAVQAQAELLNRTRAVQAESTSGPLLERIDEFQGHQRAVTGQLERKLARRWHRPTCWRTVRSTAGGTRQS